MRAPRPRPGRAARRGAGAAGRAGAVAVALACLVGGCAAALAEVDIQTDQGIAVVNGGDVLNAWSTGLDREYDADTAIAWFFWMSATNVELLSTLESADPAVVPVPELVVPNTTVPTEFTQFAVVHTCQKAGSSLITWTLDPVDAMLDPMVILYVKRCANPIPALQIRAPDGQFLVRDGVAQLSEPFFTHNESLAVSVYTTSPAVSLSYYFLDIYSYDVSTVESIGTHFVSRDAVATVQSQEPPVYMEHNCDDQLDQDSTTLVLVHLNFTSLDDSSLALEDSMHAIAVFYTIECKGRFDPFGSILTAALLVSVPVVVLLGAFVWSKRRKAKRILEWTFKLQDQDEQL